MNEVIGLCAYCGRPAKYTCSLCGALVCEKHFVKEKGICTVCAAGKK